MNRNAVDRLDLIAFALLGASAIGTAAIFDRLPDPMPTHFDAHGHPNGWMPRAVGAFLVPALGVVLWGFVRFGGELLAKGERERLEASPLSSVALIISGFLAALQFVLMDAALKPVPRLGDGVWSVLGALFIMLGLVMPRVRRNPWVGVRTPWTLASDENWARTHRFAGYTMILGGGASVVASMAGVPLLGVGLVLVGAFAPVFYSWRISRDAG